MKISVTLIAVVMISSILHSMDITQVLDASKPKTISDDEFTQRAIKYLKTRTKRALDIKRMQRNFWVEAERIKDPFAVTLHVLKQKTFRDNPDFVASLPYSVEVDGIKKQTIQYNQHQNDKFNRILGKHYKNEAKDYYPFFCFLKKMNERYCISTHHIELLKTLTIVFELPSRKYQQEAKATDEYNAFIKALEKEIDDLKSGIRDLTKDYHAYKLSHRSTTLSHLPAQKPQEDFDPAFLESPRKKETQTKRVPTPVRIRPQQTIAVHHTRIRSRSFDAGDMAKKFEDLRDEERATRIKR